MKIAKTLHVLQKINPNRSCFVKKSNTRK